jgi:hypothetical protein
MHDHQQAVAQPIAPERGESTLRAIEQFIGRREAGVRPCL